MSEKEADVESLMTAAEENGVACSSVENGHVLVFTKRQLEAILAKMIETEQEKCVVFVKRPDPPPGPLN